MGLKDRFPQPVSWQKTGIGAADSLANEIEFPLVLPRAETENTRIVTEITKIVYDVPARAIAVAVTGSGLRMSLTYRGLTAVENDQTVPTATVGHEAVLDAFSIVNEHNGTAASAQVVGGVYEHSIGSGGAGLIFPGNKLFVNISSNVDTSASTYGISVYYRQHLVGLTEFMGILATRQQQ